MGQPVVQASLAGGEMSPALYARIDLAKYATGAALLENWTVDYRGGIFTSQGTRFINAVKFKDKKTVIRGFIVSRTVSYTLEFGDEYVRFFSNGEPIVEAPQTLTDVTEADPAVFTIVGHVYTDGQWVFIDGIGGIPELNERWGIVDNAAADTFELLSPFTGLALSALGLGPYTSGGTASRVYELETPWDELDLAELKFAQSADVLTVVHPDYNPHDITRLTASTFSIDPFDPGSKTPTPEDLVITEQDAGDSHTLTFGYAVTAIGADGKDESLPVTGTVDNAYLREFESPPRMNDLVWDPVPLATSYNIYKWGGIVIGSDPLTTYGFIGQAIEPNFTDNNIGPDFSVQAPEHRDPFTDAGGAILGFVINAKGSGYVDPIVSITGGGGTGATAVATARIVDGAISSVTIVNPGTGYDPNTTTVTITGAPGTGADVDVGAVTSADSAFPSVVSYYQQRRVFAASINEPETMWFSKIALPSNFDVSPAVLDSDAVTATLSSLQVNAINALVPTSQGLIGFTVGGIWIISGETAQQAITPTAISALPQDVPGAAGFSPLSINANLLYVQSTGIAVREVRFQLDSFSLQGSNRSELAMHLLEDTPLLEPEWCWAAEPHHLVWGIREDGYAVTMTFVPEQEVYAWARRSTQGLFVSVCSVPEDRNDAVYFIVKRYIAGVWQQYIERLVERDWGSDVEKIWSLDCGLRRELVYPAANITLSATTGVATVTADAAVFSPGNRVLRAGGGRASTVTFIDSTHITITIHQAFPMVPQTEVPLPFEEGEWSLTTKVSTVTGLHHLAGATVDVLADGNAYEDLEVAADGTLEIPNSASLITVGLAYSKRAQTLALPAEAIQGKYKVNPSVTLKILNAKGLYIGPTFEKLVPVNNVEGYVAGAIPIPLQSGITKTNILNRWDKLGQICLSLDTPFAAEVLTLIPEVEVGSK